jgi:hypothetical protein
MEQKKDFGRLARNALILLTMIGLIVYVVYHCLQYFEDPVQTTVAVRQTEQQTLTLEAYLFRDETVLTSSHGGALQSLTADGAHVAIESEVARVYITGDGEELYARLQALNEKIAFYEQCLVAEGFAPAYLNTLDEEIARTQDEIQRAKAAGASVLELSDELLLLLNQRQVMTGEFAELPTLLNTLKEERRALENTYAGTYESITTAQSGYYFRETDGYETLFTNTALEGASFDSFFELIAQQPLATDTHAGKLIGDYIWYAAIPATVTEVQMLTEGVGYLLHFADGTAVNMTLDRILTKQGDERCVLIMKTGHMPQGFDYTRIQTVTMEIGTTSGLRVPQTALIVGKDGEMGVYVLDVAYVRYRKIDIVWRGDGYVLVRENDRTKEGHENDLGYQELLITHSDEALYDGQLLY